MFFLISKPANPRSGALPSRQMALKSLLGAVNMM